MFAPGKAKEPKAPRLTRAAREFFEPWDRMDAATREACRRDLEVAGAAMGRVFDRTGDADAYAQRMIRFLLLVGSRKLLGKSLPECYAEARGGIPSEWHPFLDRMFGLGAVAS